MTRWHNGLGLLSLIILFALAASDPIDLPPLGWFVGGLVAGGFGLAYVLVAVGGWSDERKGAK
jgi:hypothetical protein